jgi:ABC-2 type transport system permease protein
MRVVLAMVAKDLRRRLRTPLASLLLLLFPLVFAGLIALTFGGEAKPPRVRLLLEDRDGDLVGRVVRLALQQPEARRHFEVLPVASVAGDGGALIEEHAAAALLRLPAGLTDDLLAGRPARLELIKSPAQSLLPEIAEQSVAVLADALSSAAQLLRGPLAEIRTGRQERRALPNPTAATPTSPPYIRQEDDLALLARAALRRARPYVWPSVLQLATTPLPAPSAPPAPPAPGGAPGAAGSTGTGGGGKATGSNRPAAGGSLFLLFLPGIAVYSLFSLADQTMRDLLVEARLKTLRRQLAAPITAGRVLVGKALVTAAVAGLAVIILTVLGSLVARRGIDLAGYLLLSLALVIATTGFASAVFAAARNERQGATLASMLALVMAFAGGAFIPLDNLPRSVQQVAPASLIFWASRGYHLLVLDGAGLGAVLPEIAVLAGVGLLLLAISGPLWQRRLLRGELS